MKTPFLKVLCLSLGLTVIASSGQAAALQDSKKSNQTHSSVVKLSPMTKALNQQKKSLAETTNLSNDVRILTSIQTTPSQNFFAEQHQRFSRFVQSIFPTHDS